MSQLDSTDPRGVYVPKPRWDIYTSLLLVAFLAIIIAIVCLCLEMSRYEWQMKATGVAMNIARTVSTRMLA